MFWRAYHMPGPSLSHRCMCGGAPECAACAGTGREPTKATYQFIRDILRIIKDDRPNRLAVVFDGPRADLRRRQVYPEYKTNRSAMTDDALWQLMRIKRILKLIRVCTVECSGHEADDAIATLATQTNDPVTIWTRDKDFRQLCVHRHITLFDPVSKTNVNWSNAGQKWGLSAGQMFDFLVLVGDGIDNVPGIPGFGEKTAAKYLKLYKNIEGIIDAATGGLLSKSHNASIVSLIKTIERNKTLIQLDRSVPMGTLGMSTELVSLRPAIPLFAQLGFRSLLG